MQEFSTNDQFQKYLGSELSCSESIGDLGEGSFSVLVGKENISTAAEITGIVEVVIGSSQIWLLIRSTRGAFGKLWLNSRATESVSISRAQEPLF